jgi:hypothetical protein
VKIFTSYTSDKGLITRIYRELQKLTFQRINNPLNKWADEPNRQFSKEVQRANKHKKTCSASLAIKEMHIKMNRDCTSLLLEWIPSVTQTTTNAVEVMEKQEHFFTTDRNLN